jgi:hypothetical protein
LLIRPPKKDATGRGGEYNPCVRTLLKDPTDYLPHASVL